jgi:peptidoglycan/xylan/chitin deacetylase (PgdA/CDA1 family)
MILTYHKIAGASFDNMTVDVEHFKKQMNAVRCRQIVYLDEYDPSNPNHVVIRFDDGFKDLTTYALPILREYKYKFEVFLVERYVEWGNTNLLIFAT